MKKKEFIVIFSFPVLFLSCVFYHRKLESHQDTLLAEDLIKNNLSYTDSLNDSNRKGFEEALNYVNKAIALDSSNIRAYNDKQSIFINLGRGIDTLTAFKILELKPDFAEEQELLGIYYESIKKNQSANEAYKKAKSIYLERPSSDGRNLNLIILEFRITNDRSETLEKLKQFPIKDPRLARQVMFIINDTKKGD